MNNMDNFKDWTDYKIIFTSSEKKEDFCKGTFSFIWGKFKGDICLGMRWDGDKGKPAFPNGQWVFLPIILTESILKNLLRIAQNEKSEMYSSMIEKALLEFSKSQ